MSERPCHQASPSQSHISSRWPGVLDYRWPRKWCWGRLLLSPPGFSPTHGSGLELKTKGFRKDVEKLQWILDDAWTFITDNEIKHWGNSTQTQIIHSLLLLLESASCFHQRFLILIIENAIKFCLFCNLAVPIPCMCQLVQHVWFWGHPQCHSNSCYWLITQPYHWMNELNEWN